MPAIQGSVQDPGFLVLVILVVTLGVLFWRFAIKLLVIGAISLVVLGLSELWRLLH